ncbi:MAG: hypothetical protein HYV47_00295 [Candidatus Nealsonbacteria bacterium]|nr:hypothetical protein [Candidatus Nealsonbacteria bacterium]
MSHIAVYKTTLGEVNTDILKKTLEILALEETGIEIRDYIEDYYGKKHSSWEGNKIIGAIFSRQLQKGVGVSVDKQGHLVFISHELGPAFEKIKARIEHIYKVVALAIALQNMGYEIQADEKMTTLEATLNKNKISIEMKGKGDVATDLEGFAGKTCFEEAQKLAEMLKELGVNVDAKDLQPKPESQIEPPERQKQSS